MLLATRSRSAVEPSTLDPAEAEWIRQGCEAIIEGRSLRSIAAEWREAGVISSKGKPFSATSIRRVLIAPRNAGLRVRHGQVIGQGQWEPIIAADTWRAVTSMISRHARPHAPGAGGGCRECFVAGNAVRRCGSS